MKPASPGAQYTVPPEPSRTPAILLAVAVHAVLLAFLYFGISWQNNTPISVEAEVWDMKVETAAAPPLPAPVVEPEPQPEPEPTPPAPTPPPPPPPKVVEPEPVKPAAPDIALEREKQRKIELAKKEREERELAQKKERELAEKKERDEQKKKELAEEKRREEVKEREEQKKKELAEKKKEEDKKKEDEKKLAEKAEADKKKKLAAEKAAKAKADAAAQAQLDKLRDLELKRIAGAAGSTGNAQKSSAPKLDSGYQAAIAAKVKSNTVYTGGDEPGNPTVEFRIEQLPTGEILSARKTKSSGVPSFDEAVERGIIKSSPLPKKKDGTVERTFPLSFKLKDLQ